MPLTEHTVTLVKREVLSPRVSALTFQSDAAELLAFIPGQFITFHLTINEQYLRRSYSIANRDGRDGCIEIAYSHVPGGRASQILADAKLGSTWRASGPFGRLVLPDEAPMRYILIATGTGITPYRSMLGQLSALSSTEVVIVHGVVSPKEAIYQQDFVEWMHQSSRFRFINCYSRELPDGLQDFEVSGRVQSALPGLNLNPTRDCVFLCGNPHMIDEVFAELKALDFSVSSIRREKYIST